MIKSVQIKFDYIPQSNRQFATILQHPNFQSIQRARSWTSQLQIHSSRSVLGRLGFLEEVVCTLTIQIHIFC